MTQRPTRPCSPQFPETAKLANIQCENCHGPQNSAAHTQGRAAAEPVVRRLRHLPRRAAAPRPLPAVAAQPRTPTTSWRSRKARAEPAPSATPANGFLAWLPVLDGAVPGDPNDSVEVTWTEDETHPQTCADLPRPARHRHHLGRATTPTRRCGSPATRRCCSPASSPTDVGRGAICMTCHNTRRGLRNDRHLGRDRRQDRAPHLGAQTDVLMGQNVYFVEVGAAQLPLAARGQLRRLPHGGDPAAAGSVLQPRRHQPHLLCAPATSAPSATRWSPPTTSRDRPR